MGTFKAKGIVLREVFVGEADKSLTILLKDYGKFNIWAKNSRSPKSNLSCSTSLFSYSEFVIYDNGRSISLNQADLIENFFSLTENLDSLAYGTYFLELTDKSIQEATPLNNIMLLLLKSLLILSKSKTIPPKLVAKIFEIKFLQLNGYMPVIQNCYNCHNEIINLNDNIYFGKNGVICNNCKNYDFGLIKINSSIIYTLNYIFTSNLNNLYTFNLSQEMLEILSNISRNLLNEHIYANIKSKNFIDEIEKPI